METLGLIVVILVTLPFIWLLYCVLIRFNNLDPHHVGAIPTGKSVYQLSAAACVAWVVVLLTDGQIASLAMGFLLSVGVYSLFYQPDILREDEVQPTSLNVIPRSQYRGRSTNSVMGRNQLYIKSRLSGAIIIQVILFIASMALSAILPGYWMVPVLFFGILLARAKRTVVALMVLSENGEFKGLSENERDEVLEKFIVLLAVGPHAYTVLGIILVVMIPLGWLPSLSFYSLITLILGAVWGAVTLPNPRSPRELLMKGI